MRTANPLIECLAVAAGLLALSAITTPILAEAKSSDHLGGKLLEQRRLAGAGAIYNGDFESQSIGADDLGMKAIAPARGVTLGKGKNKNFMAGSGVMTVNTGNGINWNGGPVMSGTVHAYVIWYGTWSAGDQSLINNFLSNIGGTPYYNINTTYGDATSNVSGAVTLSGSTSDNYSQGKRLSDAKVKTIVSNAITSGKLPLDASGIYFVLTAADVSESSGFCSRYCGWHTYGSISGMNVKYSFVGNPAKCPSSCAAQSPGPNGSVGADGAVSIIVHELEEANTDPLLNAWYDSSGAENADKCAWKFGTTSGPTGGKYNVTLGGKNYLIQQNWVNKSGGYCEMSVTH